MNETLKKIHEYLISIGYEEEGLPGMDQSSVYLAMEISEYAHRNQKRENGEDYVCHPIRVLQSYRNLVGITENDLFCIDVDMMRKYGIPFNGVQEVCILHDVIEDTEITYEELRQIYVDCGFEVYFDSWIGYPLKLVTHDKSVPYLDYIKIVMSNPIASMVKMLDLQDNLRVIDLIELNDENYDRNHRYLDYIYMINYKYEFLENIKKYNDEFKGKGESK